jgi:hypothetical protein
MRGQPWRYSGLVWRGEVMGLCALAWACAGLLASRREFVRDGGGVPLWDKTPPGVEPGGGGWL